MRALRLASLVSFITLALAGPVAARGGLPEPLTPRGVIIEDIYYKVFLAAVIVFLFVMALLVFVMWRYRASSGHGRATFEMERENLKLEMMWIIIPLFIVGWVGFIAYVGLIQLDNGIDDDDVYMDLYVTASQWNWKADYGEGVELFANPGATDGVVAAENHFLLPANVPIRITLTSADVIHAWSMLDANWNQFALIDANPTGPHAENSLIVELPVGEYQVQCKEMCFNPGHAYMRAVVEAVPMSQYEAWLERETLLAPCEIRQEIAFTIDAAFTDGVTQLVNSGCAVVDITNGMSEPLTFTADGYTGFKPEATIQPGETGLIVFEPRLGASTISFGDKSISFDAVEAQVINVELGDFYITPASFTMEAGTTYLILLDNVGATSHNLYLGGAVSEGDDAQFRSGTVDGGAKGSFLVTPTEPMDFVTWCNISGHAGLGMVASASVA